MKWLFETGWIVVAVTLMGNNLLSYDHATHIIRLSPDFYDHRYKKAEG